MKKTVLILTLVLFTGLTAGFWNIERPGDVGIIQLDGQITPAGSGFGVDGITPDRVERLNSNAVEQGADAVIYEWNSGGGAVVASKEVMREIESVEKPTVCRFRDVSASGAYLASLGCDRIVADSVSTTGSIGVTASYLEFSELLDEFGVNYVNVTGGELKEVGSPFKNATDEEIEVMENLVDQVHEEFLTTVEENRNITKEDMEEVSTGRIFLGSEAEEMNLVDSIGGRETAVEEAENLTNQQLEPFKVETQDPFNFLNLLLASTDFSQLLETEFSLTSRLG